MCSSADASLSPSQATAHGSWSMWIATPSYSFIVSDLHRLLIAGLPAHCERFWTLPRWGGTLGSRPNLSPAESGVSAAQSGNVVLVIAKERQYGTGDRKGSAVHTFAGH